MQILVNHCQDLGFHTDGDRDSVGVLSTRVIGSDSCFERIALAAPFRLDFKEASSDACINSLKYHEL